MNEPASRLSTGYIFAWISLITGGVILLGVGIVQPPLQTLVPIAYFALSFIALGTGELFNHPMEETRTLKNGKSMESITVQKIRRRNSCGLGHLFDIIGILMFFIAAAKYFYGPH